MQMQLVSINKLKNNTGQVEGLPKNPRVLKDDKFKKLVKSIQDDPEMLELREVIAYDNNGELVVIAGNMRLKACQDVGLKEIPTKILPQNTPIEKLKAYTIKDNVAFGEHDWNELANSWDVEELTEWGLDIPNFDVNNLEAEEDDFAVPDGGTETDIVLGDLFEIGEHRLLCGDSTDSDQVAKLMNGQKADMVFTDPPYGMFLDTDYSKIKGTENSIGFKGNKTGNKYDKIIGDNEDFTPELINTIFASFPKTKEIFIWGADYFVDLLPNYGKDGSWLVWNKRSSEAQQRGIGNCFELCWSLNKHKRFVLDFEWFGFLSKDDPNEARNRQHPSMKPSKLISRMINEFCKDATIIVDIFLGSGTTMLATHQLKRKCYGMELDPKYCQVIVDRMKKLDPSLIIKKNGVTL